MADPAARSAAIPDDQSDMAVHFVAFAGTAGRRAPLYASLSTLVGERPHLVDLLLSAPTTQRLPVLLFAVVHHLVLDDPDCELAQWYPNITEQHRSPDDPALMTTFEGFVEAHREAIITGLRTRSTQTNEIGRCGLLLPVFGFLEEEVGPLGHLDVGTSAGLTLLTDRFAYRYRPRTHEHEAAVVVPSGTGSTEHRLSVPSGTGSAEHRRASVAIDVETTGAAPIPRRMPRIAARLGVDRAPIDISDPIEARWLEACVWPDQADRFHRLVAAIEIASESPPEVIAGDAVESLANGIEAVGAAAHPVVTNTWVLNYLSPEERIAYLAELERIGASRDLSWIYAEAPALIPELPNSPDPRDPHLTVLTLVRWRRGHRAVDHLATCHPHGYWLHWR